MCSAHDADPTRGILHLNPLRLLLPVLIEEPIEEVFFGAGVVGDFFVEFEEGVDHFAEVFVGAVVEEGAEGFGRVGLAAGFEGDVFHEFLHQEADGGFGVAVGLDVVDGVEFLDDDGEGVLLRLGAAGLVGAFAHGFEFAHAAFQGDVAFVGLAHAVGADVDLVADLLGEAAAGVVGEALVDELEQQAVEVEALFPIGLGEGDDLGQEGVEADEVPEPAPEGAALVLGDVL